MARRTDPGRTARVLAAVVALLAAGAAAAQAEPQRLTVAVAVCPAGYEGTDLAAACGDRLARAFTVSVTDFSSSAPFADDIPPGVDGRATIDLTGRTPASLTVAVNPAVAVGSRAVVCAGDGAVPAAEFVGQAAAVPVFRIDVETAADVACTVYVYGFADDDTHLDIVEGRTGAGEQAPGGAELPRTGSGPVPGDGTDPYAPLAVLLVLAGGFVWLRVRWSSSA